MEFFSGIVAHSEVVPADDGERLGRSIEAYIQKNYVLDISLTMLAEEFGLSESYISRFFHEYSGSTFKTYLNRYRINKAKELLAEDELKVREVATEVGFLSSDTFIKIFRKMEGISPGRYGSTLHAENRINH
jgi:YesN/AraC family two-component response regulator